MMITSVNGYMKGYWYQEGYIRTSSQKFNTTNLEDKFIHLTNDAVQKHGTRYGKFEKGNKISFLEFLKFCEQNEVDFQEQLLSKMKNLAAHAIKSVYGKIDPKKRQNCFEVILLEIYLLD